MPDFRNPLDPDEAPPMPTTLSRRRWLGRLVHHQRGLMVGNVNRRPSAVFQQAAARTRSEFISAFPGDQSKFEGWLAGMD